MSSVVIVGLFAIQCPAVAIAQSGSDSAGTTASAAGGDADVGLQDIVVTAQRRTQEISQVPISVQAIGATELSRSGPLDTTTLLGRLSPSVNFQAGSSLNASTVSIRGVSSVATEGGIQPSTSIVMDGVPLYRQGEFITDLNDVESIEVLRGPQGTLFGKNSSAGVINITTRRPGKEFGGNVQLGYTTDDERYANGAIDLPVSDTIRTRFTAFFRDQKPLVENLGPAEDPLGAKSYGFAGKIEADLTPDLNLLVAGGYNHLRSTYNLQFVLTPPAAFDTPAGNLQSLAAGIAFNFHNDRVNTDADTFAIAETTYGQAELNWTANDRVTISSITSYRVYNGDQVIDSDGTPYGFEHPNGINNPIGYPFLATESLATRPTAPEYIKYGSEELRLHYQGDRADIVAGLFYQTAAIKSHATNPFIFDGGLLGLTPGVAFAVDSRYRYTLDNDSAAAFADITYKLTDSVTVFTGARFTHETLSEFYHRDDYFAPASFLDPNTFDFTIPPNAGVTEFRANKTVNNVSGRAGVQWRPTEGQNYYASYNRGYKGPAASTGRAGSNSAAFPAIVKPEIANAFEIGTKQRLFDNRVSLGLSLYTQKIANIQQTGNVPGSTFQILQSAGDLKSKGAEFEMQWQVVPGLRFSSGVAYTDAKYSGANAVVACPSSLVCPGNGSTIAPGFESISGKQAINSPKWAFNTAADYVVDVGSLGKIALNLAYSWKSKIQYSNNQDPRTIEPSHGFLNASATLISNHGWEVQVYGRNLTNEFYHNRVDSAFPVGDAFGYYARDYKRFGGASVKYKF